MIVKKLYRRVGLRWWDKDRKVYQNTTVTDYVGWFLFGLIPIYLIQLDKHEEVNFKDTGEGTLNYGVIEKYKHIMYKND